jgi:hypothetical protein
MIGVCAGWVGEVGRGLGGLGKVGSLTLIKYYYLIINCLPQMKYLAAYALLALSGKKDICT